VDEELGKTMGNEKGGNDWNLLDDPTIKEDDGGNFLDEVKEVKPTYGKLSEVKKPQEKPMPKMEQSSIRFGEKGKNSSQTTKYRPADD
jgi:hypothetical protein